MGVSLAALLSTAFASTGLATAADVAATVLPGVLGAAGTALTGAEVGLGVNNALSGPPKPPPVTTIPGSPIEAIGNGAPANPGSPVGLPQSSVLSQVLGTGGSGSTGAGAGIASAGSTSHGGAGGGGGSVTPPVSIGGGTGAGVGSGQGAGLLPWLQGLTNGAPAIAAPGTPQGL